MTELVIENKGFVHNVEENLNKTIVGRQSIVCLAAWQEHSDDESEGKVVLFSWQHWKEH